METLLSHVIAPADATIDEKTCFKNSTISCELLTCDNPAINDAFFTNIELTNRLYSFLLNEPPLNPLLASYFAKIIGSLILRKTDQVNIIKQFLKGQLLNKGITNLKIICNYMQGNIHSFHSFSEFFLDLHE